MGSLPLPSALRSRKAKEFWRACRRKSSRRRFNSMVPAFHRVHDAEGHIARRVIIRLLFDPFTVKWACAFVGSEDVPARGRSRVASQRCSQTRTRSRELRYLTAKMAALLPFGKGADFLGDLHRCLLVLQPGPCATER